MIWPFRKTEKLSDAESFRLAAEQEPPTPCGKPVEHLTWKLNGVRCPLCAGIAQREREAEAEGRLAKKIAAEVVALMQPSTTMPPEACRDFENWWKAHGQYCRAGGGDYEKTFAFHAWQAAIIG